MMAQLRASGDDLPFEQQTSRLTLFSFASDMIELFLYGVAERVCINTVGFGLFDDGKPGVATPKSGTSTRSFAFFHSYAGFRTRPLRRKFTSVWYSFFCGTEYWFQRQLLYR